MQQAVSGVRGAGRYAWDRLQGVDSDIAMADAKTQQQNDMANAQAHVAALPTAARIPLQMLGAAPLAAALAPLGILGGGAAFGAIAGADRPMENNLTAADGSGALELIKHMAKGAVGGVAGAGLGYAGGRVVGNLATRSGLTDLASQGLSKVAPNISAALGTAGQVGEAISDRQSILDNLGDAGDVGQTAAKQQIARQATTKAQAKVLYDAAREDTQPLDDPELNALLADPAVQKQYQNVVRVRNAGPNPLPTTSAPENVPLALQKMGVSQETYARLQALGQERANPIASNPSVPPARSLARYAPTMYRETNIDRAIPFLDPSSTTDLHYQDIHLADQPHLALGQNGNTGVVFEFDTKGLQGTLNQSKPGLAVPGAGDVGREFVASGNPQSAYTNAVRSVTIKPDADAMYPSLLKRLQNVIVPRLENQGWAKTMLEDGSIQLTRPAVTAASTATSSRIPMLSGTDILPPELSGGAPTGVSLPDPEALAMLRKELYNTARGYQSSTSGLKQEEALTILDKVDKITQKLYAASPARQSANQFYAGAKGAEEGFAGGVDSFKNANNVSGETLTTNSPEAQRLALETPRNARETPEAQAARGSAFRTGASSSYRDAILNTKVDRGLQSIAGMSELAPTDQAASARSLMFQSPADASPLEQTLAKIRGKAATMPSSSGAGRIPLSEGGLTRLVLRKAWNAPDLLKGVDGQQLLTTLRNNPKAVADLVARYRSGAAPLQAAQQILPLLWGGQAAR